MIEEALGLMVFRLRCGRWRAVLNRSTMEVEIRDPLDDDKLLATFAYELELGRELYDVYRHGEGAGVWGERVVA